MTCKWFTSGFKRKSQIIDNDDDSRHEESLDHPELRRMTMRELADLPLPAYTLKNCS